jgi:hypothetical protein
MPDAPDPTIAIVGNVTAGPDADAAAEHLGRELAKAGFRIAVYASDPGFLDAPVVRGYVASQVARPRSIDLRYPLNDPKTQGQRPAFPEEKTHAQLFASHADRRPDWEMSFYQSLSEVDGILLLGGGQTTMISGVVARGRRIAIVAVATFGGDARKIWDALQPGADLVTADEISLMARPSWSAEVAAECVKSLHTQLARRAEEERQRKLQALRQESVVRRHAQLAVALFVAAWLTVPLAWGADLSLPVAIWLLFLSPLLAGVSGSTIRLVFDLRQGVMPLTPQSALTTAALGLIAGGVAGLLFVTAQMTTVPEATMSGKQASRLVPFGVVVGFIAGLTLDAVFRKLVASDVVDVSPVEARKRT